MAQIRVENLSKAFQRLRRREGIDLHDRRGLFLCHAGAVGLRQDDDLAHDRRARAPERGADPARRRGRHLPTRRRARHRLRLPALCSLSAHERRRQHRLPPEMPGGRTRARSAGRSREAARLLRIDHLLSRRVSNLSGGDRQRVALGRAIVRRPKAFLMDEPLGALDAELRSLMCEELRDLHDRIGATTIYVTHDQLEAMSMADRIAVMNQGVRRADRHAAGDLRSAGEHVCRRFRRLAADELDPLRRETEAERPIGAAGRRKHRHPGGPRGERVGIACARRPARARVACRFGADPGPRFRNRIPRHDSDRHRRHRPRPDQGAIAVEPAGQARRDRRACLQVRIAAGVRPRRPAGRCRARSIKGERHV